jgi:hypothetical protein
MAALQYDQAVSSSIQVLAPIEGAVRASCRTRLHGDLVTLSSQGFHARVTHTPAILVDALDLCRQCVHQGMQCLTFGSMQLHFRASADQGCQVDVRVLWSLKREESHAGDPQSVNRVCVTLLTSQHPLRLSMVKHPVPALLFAHMLFAHDVRAIHSTYCFQVAKTRLAWRGARGSLCWPRHAAIGHAMQCSD